MVDHQKLLVVLWPNRESNLNPKCVQHNQWKSIIKYQLFGTTTEPSLDIHWVSHVCGLVAPSHNFHYTVNCELLSITPFWVTWQTFNCSNYIAHDKCPPIYDQRIKRMIREVKFTNIYWKFLISKLANAAPRYQTWVVYVRGECATHTIT